MSFYGRYPPTGGSGGGVPTYASLAVFPSAAVAGNGALAIALDTNILYESNGTSWLPIAGPGDVLSIGTFDSGTPSANGAHIDSDALIMQSASASNPGLVNTTTQTLAGVKTFSSAPNLSSLTASTALVLDSSKNVASSAIGNLTDAGTDGIVVTGGTGAVLGTGTSLAQHVADTSHNGYLSSTDWNTFNGKQPALTTGNLTDAGTDGITVTGGTGAVIGSGTSISQHVADTTHNGYLSSSDWNTFNGKGAGSVTSVAMTVPTFLSVSGSPVTTTGTLGVSLSGTALPIANGGTAVTSVTVAPAATSFAGWDANKNLSANSHITGYTTTATGAGTTTLLVGSTQQQYFTGTTTQTVVLPVTNTLVLGQTFQIVNNSTGVVTVQSSGANNILAMAANSTCTFTVILTSGTTAASWNAQIKATGAPTQQAFTSGTGTYTTPAGVSWIRVRMVGGGGGGASGGNAGTGTNGGDGGDTTFGSSLLTAGKGSKGTFGGGGGTGGPGGSATVNSPAIGIGLSGGHGSGGPHSSVVGDDLAGAPGGASGFGGNGGGGGESTAGTNGATNTGGGGGGGGASSSATSNFGGDGGGSGAFIDALISSPAATYSYAVGAAGAAGSPAGTAGFVGGAGGSGYIIVEEHYI